ncbi:hypothetical protein HGM15179_012297 [Zosterops borbonicus]|uniref:Uncharacterized protein n=1 Tax=Zosterops borbonicus TaxID=364589 RepID=A0A8K1GAH7_9PASS|nr:hypothetical protein HGM15179_012297 [Zosterops borbonicus]
MKHLRAPAPVFLAQTIIILCLLSLTTSWIVPQLKANVWKTLAQAMGQDHLCLSQASAKDPTSSCLAGIPHQEKAFPPALLQMRATFNRNPSRVSHFTEINGKQGPVNNPLVFWREWTSQLPEMPQELQELDLLGSSPAHFCVQFMFTPPPDQKKSYQSVMQVKEVYWAGVWCKFIAHVQMASTGSKKSLSLPTGTFLICGDRAFTSIPLCLIGGPCTLGKLGLFTPNKTHIMDWTVKNSSSHAPVQKRDLANLDPDCNLETVHWSRAKATAATIFLPWVSITKAMGELG